MNRNQMFEILNFLYRVNTLKTVLHYRASLLNNGNTTEDHAWRLGVLVSLIAKELRVDVNTSRAITLALLHDLSDLDHEGMDEGKEKNILIEDMQALWKEYREQTTLEAKFVRALDTIEPFLQLSDDGSALYLPLEYQETYIEDALENCKKAMEIFPAIKLFLDLLEQEFESKVIFK